MGGLWGSVWGRECGDGPGRRCGGGEPKERGVQGRGCGGAKRAEPRGGHSRGRPRGEGVRMVEGPGKGKSGGGGSEKGAHRGKGGMVEGAQREGDRGPYRGEPSGSAAPGS